MSEQNFELDKFITGENIDLCIPTEEFALKSEWYSWFNDSDLNTFLDQGALPNTPEQQLQFLRAQRDQRVLLVIRHNGKYVGVVSLSMINHQKRSAQFAIVLNHKIDFKNSPYIALEAAARITEHGFKTLGLDRIWAGQHIRLASWGQRLELLGYRTEGITRNGFVKGRDVSDTLLIACSFQNYLRLVEKRKSYWDSLEKMKDRLAKLPKEKFSEQLDAFFDTTGSDYFSKIEAF